MTDSLVNTTTADVATVVRQEVTCALNSTPTAIEI